MNHTNNRRVQMTKHMICESVLEIVQKKDINHISVRELCETADVNRSTFYKYYQSIYDVIEDMEANFCSQIEHQIVAMDTSDSPEYNMIQILGLIQRNQVMSQVLLNASVDPDFPTKLLYQPFIAERLKQATQYKDEATASYIDDFIIYGVFQVIKKWLNNGCTEPIEDIAKLIYTVAIKILLTV